MMAHLIHLNLKCECCFLYCPYDTNNPNYVKLEPFNLYIPINLIKYDYKEGVLEFTNNMFSPSEFIYLKKNYISFISLFNDICVGSSITDTSTPGENSNWGQKYVYKSTRREPFDIYLVKQVEYKCISVKCCFTKIQTKGR